MKKIIYRNPREDLDFKNLKGENTLLILPSQASINFYIRNMLKKGIDITKTNFDSFDGIGKKIRNKMPDPILKYIILSRILKENFENMEIFPETVDIVLDFFDHICENNLESRDLLEIKGEIFKGLGEVFEIYRDYFCKKGYDIYGRPKDFFLENISYDSIIISGFLEFRQKEKEIIKKLSKIDDKNIYIDLPFNFMESDLIFSTIKNLEEDGFILEDRGFLAYKDYLKNKPIKIISSKNDFYNLFFSQLKILLKDKKIEDIEILTGSKKLAEKIKSRENFEGLDFNLAKSENSLLKSEFIILMDYFLNKNKENSLKRLRLSYFPIEADEISLEVALMAYDFKEIYEIDFSKIKSLEIKSDSVENFLRGVDFLKNEKIRDSADLNYYFEFFRKYLNFARERVQEKVKENPESLALRDLRFIEKMEENFLKMKKLSSIYKEISLFEFILILKKYIEKSKIDDVQNLDAIEIANYASNYYREFKDLILIGLDQNFEKSSKNNFIYSRESEEDMKKIGLIKDNFERDYIYLIYDLIMSEEIFILIEDYEKGLSKLLNKLTYDLDLKIEEHEKIYWTSKVDLDHESFNLDYNMTSEDLSGVNKKIRDRNYSVTDFDLLKDCPRRFLFERVYKIEKLQKEYEDKYYIMMGDKYHHILEKYFKRESALNIETLKKLILEEENLGDYENLSFLEKISVINSFNTLKNYIEKDLEEQKKYGFMPEYFEEGFLMDVRGLKIKGRIDRIDALGDKEILIDYKRSKGRTKKEIEDLKSFQMPLYAIARRKMGKKIAMASYGAIKKAELDTVIKNSDILPKDDSKKYYFSEEELSNLLKKVEEEIIYMTNSITSGDYNSTCSCDKCDYKEICENKEI